MDLNTFTQEKIKDMKNAGLKVDCFSYKRESLPSGKATIDCDVAIDAYGDGEFGQFKIESDPYSNGSDLKRFKFRVN